MVCIKCETLKDDNNACVCRVVYDLNHPPQALTSLMLEDNKVKDLVERTRKVVAQLGLYRRG